ncbi:hypothetical protein NL676_018439 [Syzygium grande]|nr:hypothetical protein NL676_018439 [Syzygium grande]
MSIDHDHGPVKSYTCAFCRRGFSNAQALGGHMNIHRRDRAKLRESMEESALSLGVIPSKNAVPAENHNDEKSSNKSPPKGPRTTSIENKTCAQARDDVLEQERMQSSPSSDWIELDLELRLGHERPLESSSAMSNRPPSFRKGRRSAHHARQPLPAKPGSSPPWVSLNSSPSPSPSSRLRPSPLLQLPVTVGRFDSLAMSSNSPSHRLGRGRPAQLLPLPVSSAEPVARAPNPLSWQWRAHPT